MILLLLINEVIFEVGVCYVFKVFKLVGYLFALFDTNLGFYFIIGLTKVDSSYSVSLLISIVSISNIYPIPSSSSECLLGFVLFVSPKSLEFLTFVISF